MTLPRTFLSVTLLALAASACASPTPAPTQLTPPPPDTATPSATPRGPAARCPLSPGTPGAFDLSRPADLAANLAAFLNAGGTPEALAAQLQTAGRSARAGLPLAQADVNGDGLLDLAVPVPEAGSDAPAAPGTLFVFICDANRYRLAYASPPSADHGLPVLHAAQDLNADGAADLLVGRSLCGAHTCFEAVEVLVWRGATLENRLQGTSDDLPYPTVEVRAGPDGSPEVNVTGTGLGSAGAGPYRARTRVWAWDPVRQAFAVTGEVEAPAHFRIHVLLDADQAARAGDWAKAVALYYQVITDNSLADWVDPAAERANLAAYATFRTLLARLAQGDLGDAQVDYGLLQNGYPAGAPGGGFSELGSAFWKEYELSGDAGRACAAARAFAVSHPDQVLRPLYFGYANPTYSAADLCPIAGLGTTPVPGP